MIADIICERMCKAMFFPKRPLGAVILSLVLVTVQFPLSAAAAESDYEHVTSHVQLALTRQLGILYPTQDVQTTASGFYITGTSDPGEPLVMNGANVGGRGGNGSFAVYVNLQQGANVFTFSQGGASRSVTITKGSVNSGGAAVSSDDASTKPLPQFDLAIKSGRVFQLKCFAKAGSEVTARVNGKSYNLQWNGSAYVGNYTIPASDGTTELGQVEYTITGPNATATLTSAGSLFAVGGSDTLQVQVKNTSASVFRQPSIGASITTAKKGAVDAVIGYNGDMYQLSMGGWINASTVTPLTKRTKLKNEVEDVSFSRGGGGETFTFTGSSYPIYAARQDGSKLTITFYNTVGVGGVDTSESSLFSGAAVTEQNGATTITFTQSSAGGLWGYLVEYGDGATTLFCKKRPRLSEGSAPLEGITVGIDAGHGGKDYGALGITYGTGVTEKDINLTTAVALRKKLELLGADVVMIREDDVFYELTDRLQMAQRERVDMFVSIHANSVAYTSTASSANGVEVYYYEPISKALAQNVNTRIAAVTGRVNRGTKNANFVMTLNSYAPSVLVEMGFMLNPSDFDNMTSKRGVYDTVTAISDGIIAALQ